MRSIADMLWHLDFLIFFCTSASSHTWKCFRSFELGCAYAKRAAQIGGVLQRIEFFLKCMMVGYISSGIRRWAEVEFGVIDPQLYFYFFCLLLPALSFSDRFREVDAVKNMPDIQRVALRCSPLIECYFHINRYNQQIKIPVTKKPAIKRGNIHSVCFIRNAL